MPYGGFILFIVNKTQIQVRFKDIEDTSYFSKFGWLHCHVFLMSTMVIKIVKVNSDFILSDILGIKYQKQISYKALLWQLLIYLLNMNVHTYLPQM